jgi:hypothetical protein
MKASLYDNHITLESFRYFVGKASDVYDVGVYGQKKNSLLPGNPPYLDVFGGLPAPKLAAMKLVTALLDVEFADAKGINLLANLKIPGLASGQVGVKVSDINSGKVKLLKVSPAGDNELITQINASPQVIDKLIEYGGRARVVESVLIAVEGEFYNRFSASGKSDGAVMVDGLLVKAEREANWEKSSAIQVHGMVIGYSLAEPQWNAHQDKNKTQVNDLRDDQEGW